MVIAGGLGGFQPRKPNFDGIEYFEEKGVSYFIKEPKIFKDKNVIISGGGDSALDWTIELKTFLHSYFYLTSIQALEPPLPKTQPY